MNAQRAAHHSPRAAPTSSADGSGRAPAWADLAKAWALIWLVAWAVIALASPLAAAVAAGDARTAPANASDSR
ncbi:MAG TPA: hypothetical protein VGC55_04960 [Dokdonella sp.]